MYRKRMSMAAVVVAAALSLTACGGGGNADKSSNGNASSGNSAAASGGYTPLTKANFASTIAGTYKAKSSAHMEMTMGELVKASGDVNYAGGSPSMKMTMTVSQGGKALQMEELLVNGVLYMSAPGMGMPKGKYVKIDANTPGMGGLGDLLKNVDPASMVGEMTKSLSKLDYVGTTDIAGTKTHHYKLVVDAKKAMAGLGLNNLPTGAASAVPDTLSYDAYFNDDNTLRRITMDIMGQSMQMDMTNWGTPVTVTAPPKSAVVDISKMMPSMPAKP